MKRFERLAPAHPRPTGRRIHWRSEGPEVDTFHAEASLILRLDFGARALALHSGTNKVIWKEIFISIYVS